MKKRSIRAFFLADFLVALRTVLRKESFLFWATKRPVVDARNDIVGNQSSP
jgi:hypothetical protein